MSLTNEDRRRPGRKVLSKKIFQYVPYFASLLRSVSVDFVQKISVPTAVKYFLSKTQDSASKHSRRILGLKDMKSSREREILQRDFVGAIGFSETEVYFTQNLLGATKFTEKGKPTCMENARTLPVRFTVLCSSH